MQEKEQSEPFFLQQIGDRPFGLWCIWLIGSLAWVFLIFGVMLDEISYCTFTIEGISGVQGNQDQDCLCGYESFTCLGSGFQGQEYSVADDEAIIAEQIDAGAGWLALNIIALIFSLICCFGYAKDYIDGEYDSAKPSDYWEGCPGPCQACGFSSCGMILTFFWTSMALLWYISGEKCSDVDFWDIFNNNIEDLETIGGISMALIIMSMITFVIVLGIILYQIFVLGGLPTGEKKENPVKFQKEAVGVPQELKDKANKPPPPKWEPTGKPPESTLFNPTNNVTGTKPSSGPPQPPTMSSSNPFKNQSNNTNNNKPKWGQKSGVASYSTSPELKSSKPKGPPPKPKGPPPVPKK